MNGRTPFERFSELMMMIRKQPRTVRDICEVEGVKVADFTVSRYVQQMHDAGHLYVTTWRDVGYGRAAAVYAWNPEPFQFADAKREAVTA